MTLQIQKYIDRSFLKMNANSNNKKKKKKETKLSAVSYIRTTYSPITTETSTKNSPCLAKRAILTSSTARVPTVEARGGRTGSRVLPVHDNRRQSSRTIEIDGRSTNHVAQHRTSSSSRERASTGESTDSLFLLPPRLSHSTRLFVSLLGPFDVSPTSFSFCAQRLTSEQSGMIGWIHAFALTTLSKRPF